MKATAYLCMVHAMGDDGVPRFRGFSIYSDVPWGLSASRARFCTIYYQLEADSYDEAHRRLIETCRDFKPFAWIWPWVDPSHEAHRKRFDMQRALETSGDALLGRVAMAVREATVDSSCGCAGLGDDEVAAIISREKDNDGV